MKCGYRFEDDELVDEMLTEVEGERGALPLLAFAAARLLTSYEVREEDREPIRRVEIIHESLLAKGRGLSAGRPRMPTRHGSGTSCARRRGLGTNTIEPDFTAYRGWAEVPEW